MEYSSQIYRDDPAFISRDSNLSIARIYQMADDELVKKCTARDRQSFVFADESTRGDVTVVRLITRRPKLFQFASDSLRNDPGLYPLSRV